MKNGKIEYPCSWTFRLIGREKTVIESVVSQCLGDKVHALRSANVSSTGRYLSLNLECTVESQAERDQIFRTLQTHPAILMVL